jgi:hypothetical protein
MFATLPGEQIRRTEDRLTIFQPNAIPCNAIPCSKKCELKQNQESKTPSFRPCVYPPGIMCCSVRNAVQNRCVDWRCVYARKLLISRTFTASSASASASRASTGNEVGMQWMPSQERHFRWGISVPTSRSRLWWAPLTSLWLVSLEFGGWGKEGER